MTPGISAEAERLLLLNAIGDVKFAAQSASIGAWVDGGEEILRAAGERTNTILRTSSHDLKRRLADVAYILAVQPEAMIALCDRLTLLLREPAPGSRETRHESEAREARALLADRPASPGDEAQRDPSAPFRLRRANEEAQLRQTQLGEIRAMLGLALDAEHPAVIEALADIGSFDVRIDLSAVPERYLCNALTARKNRKAGS